MYMTVNKENKLTPSCRTCALEATALSAALLICHVQPLLIQVSYTSSNPLYPGSLINYLYFIITE